MHEMAKTSTRRSPLEEQGRQPKSAAAAAEEMPSNFITKAKVIGDSASNAMTSPNPTALHLEKMGRELKCPICLSLLDQAASLTCNHVFCNACILRSIKSASVCPVCKVPCSRREVRLAPNMDSLVNIYQSMEMAAGINLFVSQPSAARDSTDDQDKENIAPCQNDLKRKLPSQRERKKKKAKACGRNPSQLSMVSSHEVIEDRSAEDIEQKTPHQAIPSHHQPVKHSFPTKKRVQVSLYPPGSVEGTPLRAVKMVSNSETKTIQNKVDGIDGSLPFTGLDNMHFGSDNQLGFSSEPKAGGAALNPRKDSSSDRVQLDDIGNPILLPFFWLREHESEETDGTQVPASQPTQITQIAQGSHSKCPSFSDLKDSDDEGYHQELQSDERGIGVTVPDTFDSEMFEWTQRPCSPELTSSPRKQQASKESKVNELPPKYFGEDRALLVNSLDKNHNGTGPVNATQHSLKNMTEDAFRVDSSPNKSKATEILEMSKLESKQASGESGRGDVTSTCIETAGVLKKPSWKEKVDLITGDEQSCHGGKVIRNMGPDSIRGAVNAEALDKKRRRKSKKGGTGRRNPRSDEFSSISNSAVCASSKKSPHDSDKELNFTTADIFDAMFGLPANGFVTDHLAIVRPHSDTEFQDQKHQHPLDSCTNAQDGVPALSALNLTPKYQQCFESTANGEDLEPTTQDDTSEMHTQAPGNGCRSESGTLENEIICAFCRTSGNSEAVGEMMHYNNGKAVIEQKDIPSKVVHVHRVCAEWAPDVYFKDDCIMNLEAEVARGMKIKCSMCGLKGAALGCCFTKCHKSFHVPCALSNPECRWDIDDFVMLCPVHSSRKFPKERKFTKSSKRDSTLSTREQRTLTRGTPHRGTQSVAAALHTLADSELSQAWTWPPGLSCKWVLCGSALDISQKEQLNKFSNLIGATITKTWSSSVTHVIASTDANGACRRTLKFLMAILEGKWVLKADWVAACIKSGHPVKEEDFEISHDIHDTYGGPKHGRERVEKKAPRLFEGLSFYLSGDFAASLKGYLQDLVSAGGGVVLHRKPIMDQPDCLCTIVLYNVELPETGKHNDKDKVVQRRLNEAKTLADALGAQLAAHTWVLESIAACQLQPTYNTDSCANVQC